MNHLKLPLLALLSALWLAGCPVLQPDPKHVSQEPEPLPEGGRATPCQSVCRRYRALKCPEGDPTPAGHSCEEVCTNAANNRIDLSGRVKCTSAAKSCEAVRVCSE